MSGTVFYKNEPLWRGSSTRFDNLSEKLLYIARQKSINPHSNLVQFIEKLGYHTGGTINRDLNSKKEIEQLAELLELAIADWEQTKYYDYYNYEENGKTFNAVLDSYQQFAKRLRKIAAYEWSDENLFINRVDTLDDLIPMLLHFAKKNIDPSSHLMKFLQLLPNREIEDIDIRSKEELNQFIELAKLSLQALKKQGYFKQYEVIKDNTTFDYVEYNYSCYIQRLKEIADNWDNAISSEWKNRKSIISTKFKPEVEPSIKPSISSKPTVKEFLKHSLLYFLTLLMTIIIVWVICSIIKYSS